MLKGQTLLATHQLLLHGILIILYNLGLILDFQNDFVVPTLDLQVDYQPEELGIQDHFHVHS